MELLIWNRGMLTQDNWESVLEYYTVSSAFWMLHSARSQARPGLGVGAAPCVRSAVRVWHCRVLVEFWGPHLSACQFGFFSCIWGKKVNPWCLFSTWHVCWATIRAPISSSCSGAIGDVCVYVPTVNTTETSCVVWKEYNHFGMSI